VDDNIEGTIWKELSGLEEALEYHKLEEQFASDQKKQELKQKKTPLNDKTFTILDPKKAYNISILLGHLKASPKRIKEAVMSCDTELLSIEHLQQMEKYAPSKKECLEYSTYYVDDPSPLNLADKFSCEMSTIPYYRERLQAMIFEAHFKEKVKEIKTDLYAIIDGCQELKNSQKLKKILELVLNIGNYMSSAFAKGFRIQFLQQLKDFKTVDRKATLLHFLVETIEAKYLHVSDFHLELKTVKIAARVSGETLELEVAELQDGLKELKKTLQTIESAQHEDDQFITYITPFVHKADLDMNSLINLYSQMKTEFTQTTKFFGESVKDIQVDDFFCIFATFIVDFEVEQS
jgi:hypothetical protein